MEEIVKHINDTNASYRTPNAGDAKNTDLFLDNEHYELFKGAGEQVTVRFSKDNLSKAILFIASILPRKYDNSAMHKSVSYSPEFVYDQLAFLDYYFKEEGVSVARKTQTWNARKDVPKKNGEIDNRFYFNGLLEEVEYVNSKGEHVSSKFTIRNYLAGGYSNLHIKKAEDGIFDVWVTNVQEAYFDDKEDGLEELDKTSPRDLHLQQIYYGAPGTGKSFQIDKNTNENNRIRTTFHPDYDYATFVGAYKPTVKTIDRYGLFGKDTVTLKHEDNTPIKEDVIVYKFIPQAFIKAYVEAWRRYADVECTDKDFYLVIEEINRGNCAQIFGDLFQLLDRTNAGFSSYAVETESDMQDFLTTDEQHKLDITLTEDIKNDNGKVIATAENVMNGKVLVLPPNLHIWATMNTSDQSLFPIDSAFKRRWDWKYVPIKYDNTDWKVMLGDKEVCKWTELQQVLNDMIYDATESEDKMLGDWFVKADGKNEINEDLLVGKIVFYLWNDVAKVDAGKLFDLEVEKNGRKRKIIFSDFYKINGEVNPDIAREWLKNINVWKNETTEGETPKETEP